MSQRSSLEREVFTLSRQLEYFTADELEKQTGYTRASWWPAVRLASMNSVGGARLRSPDVFPSESAPCACSSPAAPD